MDGAAPVQWFGADVPDGDRGPWATAPVGSQYCKKSATQTTWYTKEKNDGADNDWSVRWGEIRQTLTYSQFTDGGSTAGTKTLTETLPVGAWVLRSVLRNVTGFTGDTSAVITVGDGTDVDRYNTGTPSVFTTANAIDLGAPSGTQIHTAAATVTVTVTSGADFTSVAAGQLTISIYYLG
jgi:hypothetical protein